MAAIVYFQNDLRVHDHDALSDALKNHDKVIGVFNGYAPVLKTPQGFEKLALPRRHFLYETLRSLKRSLKALNIPLIVKNGDPSTIIKTLAKRYDIDALFMHKAIGSEEDDTLKALKRSMISMREPTRMHTLIAPDDLPFSINAMPDVFTAFRKHVESHWRVRPSLKVPNKAPRMIVLHPEDETWPDFNLDSSFVPFLEGGEEAGLKRLNYYTFESDSICTYKQTRNGLLRFDDSTKLSPYLATGALSPRLVYEHIRAYEQARGKNDGTYWVVFELLWRDFFSFIHMKYGNRLFYANGIQGTYVPWHQDLKTFEAWRTGNTGYALVDAAMRALKKTGFMSNRARQNVASFLTKNLAIDWRWGAAWFESLLIDHDVSSNYGNWQYIAGIGNDTRAFRYFNVMTQGTRYDPKGAFAHHYIDALDNVDGAMVYELPMMREDFVTMFAPNYAKPIVDFHASINQRRKTLDALKDDDNDH